MRSWSTAALVLIVVAAVAAPVKSATPSSRATKTVTTRAKAPAAKSKAHPRASSSLADTSVKPNFSGVWTLSMKRSVFGKIPGGQPAARTDSIRHAEPDLRQVLYLLNGTHRDTTVYQYRTGGTETVSAVVEGKEIRSRVEWEGRTLHLRSVTKMLKWDMSLDERWTMSANARELTMTRHIKYILGEGDQTLVFERQ